MLSNTEFSAHNRVPAELGGDMADFAMFSIDMGDCKENGKICFPHLQGKGINLWEVTPIKVETTHQIGVVENKSAGDEKELARQANLAKYISQGFAFDPMAKNHGGENQGIGEGDTPQDEGSEWDRFFALDTQLVGGKCRRKGGIKSHSRFEGFVDSSQS